jgi:SAM-dependent methyltransferase
MMKHYGREFLLDPRLNAFHRAYIRVFGVPISGLRIRLRRILPRVQGEFTSIVDLGCGKGIFTFELARRFPRARVLGIDIEDSQVKANQEIAKRLGHSNVQFEKLDILKLGELRHGNAFDLALSVDNLEHIEDDLAALRSIREALAPGGVLLCHVPAHERTWIFRGRSRNFDVAGHVRPGYRKEELLAKFRDSGFEVKWIEPTYGYLETVTNNLSYLITRAEQKNALAYALAFPLLNAVAWLGRTQNPGEEGAGWLVWAIKPVH